ncbi:MAG TPA: hypothetical protein VI704_04700, partial [Bacteroidota bacterium]|nr:hypothetical protein [Bacteroidota bacterium]
MRLNVGILGDSPAWELILQQEGLPYARVAEEISADRFSVVVIGDSIDERNADGLRRYLKNGGAILCPAQIYAQLAGTNYAHFFVRHVFPEPDSEFEDSGLVDVQKKCRVPMNANTLKSEKGVTTIYVGEFLGGHVVALPFDLDNLSLDHRSVQKSFYSPARRLPFERVSVVSRGNVRKLVARALEILHHRRSLPYAHLWYYPKNAGSVFAFRVDTDRGTQKEVEALYEVAQKHRVPMTWFVDTKSQKEMIPAFKHMVDQEFGIHCF